jgi:hypothetical protein
MRGAQAGQVSLLFREREKRIQLHKNEMPLANAWRMLRSVIPATKASRFSELDPASAGTRAG